KISGDSWATAFPGVGYRTWEPLSSSLRDILSRVEYSRQARGERAWCRTASRIAHRALRRSSGRRIFHCGRYLSCREPASEAGFRVAVAPPVARDTDSYPYGSE